MLRQVILRSSRIVMDFKDDSWSRYIPTDFIKSRIGRLRPDFFARCAYDKEQGVCTGLDWIVQEGRRSFPSGHSSSAFFGCVILMLFLAGKNRCFAYSAVFPSSGILQSRFLRLSLAISPLFLSTFVAASRWEDHWYGQHNQLIPTMSLNNWLEALISGTTLQIVNRPNIIRNTKGLTVADFFVSSPCWKCTGNNHCTDSLSCMVAITLLLRELRNYGISSKNPPYSRRRNCRRGYRREWGKRIAGRGAGLRGKAPDIWAKHWPWRPGKIRYGYRWSALQNV